MMPIQKQLPALGGTLIVLAAWMLAFTAGSYIQAVIATLLAIAAVVFNDFRRQFTLSPFYSNVASLTVFAIAVAKIPSFTGDEILLAMTDALVFLQLVLMFKQKTAYDYWLIMLANLLEVAVASALSLNYMFSVCMVIYSIAGVYTLGVLLLLNEHERYHTVLKPSPKPEQNGRWPLTGRSSNFAHTGVAPDINAGLGLDFRRRMVRVALWTLGITVTLFVVMPRVGQTSLRTFNPTQIVGFAEQISLNDIGKVAENTDRVMRVHLTDVATATPITLVDPPLWQGSSLVTYHKGEWQRSTRRSPGMRLPLESDVENLPGLVRQQVVIDPTNSTIVWCMFPAIRADYSGAVSYDRRRDQLTRVRNNQKFTCELYTLAIRDRRQLATVPYRGELSDEDRAELLQMPEVENGVDPLAPLRAIAAQIVDGTPPDDHVRRARLLEAYLSDAARFKYTLTLPKRDADLDPIVDFLTVHREGHCEYFASALALMLRAVGIPSRVVVGFKGGEIDAITSAYEVKDADAHSWVEAYLEDASVSNELKASPLWTSVTESAGESDVHGALLRLDPTPFTPGIDPSQQNIFVYLARETMMYARAAWANYVIGLDSLRQRELIYDPLKRAFIAAFQLETWVGLWQATIDGTVNLIREMLAGNPYAWFRALYILSFLTLTVMIVRRVARWASRRWWGGSDASGVLRRQIVDVPVYRRLEAILARAGHKRRREQTPREFAFLVGGELSDSADTLAVSGVPRKVVDLFYRVRFGGEPINGDEVQTLEQSLAQLTVALRKRKQRPRK